MNTLPKFQGTIFSLLKNEIVQRSPYLRDSIREAKEDAERMNIWFGDKNTIAFVLTHSDRSS